MSDPELTAIVFYRLVRGLAIFATPQPRVLRYLNSFRLQKRRASKGRSEHRKNAKHCVFDRFLCKVMVWLPATGRANLALYDVLNGLANHWSWILRVLRGFCEF